MNKSWKFYDSGPFFDELFASSGRPRVAARREAKLLQSLFCEEMAGGKAVPELAICEMGVSFMIYSEGKNIDRAWTFYIIPRVVPGKDWARMSLGLARRSSALNCFIGDIYNEQKNLADGMVPDDIVLDSGNPKIQCAGLSPRYGAWAHICGTDLVRNKNGNFDVLGDNLGIPSHLISALASLSPRALRGPCIVTLTPGIFNLAYVEPVFLAQHMGAERVEGSDLFVDDDDFLDREDSALGVPGIMRAWTSGNLASANAPGSGAADDKVASAFVPNNSASIPAHNVMKFLIADFDKDTLKLFDKAQRKHSLFYPNVRLGEELQVFIDQLQLILTRVYESVAHTWFMADQT